MQWEGWWKHKSTTAKIRISSPSQNTKWLGKDHFLFLQLSNLLQQGLSTFRMQRPFDTGPHAVVTPHRKFILWLLHHGNFATVRNCNVKIWYADPKWAATHRLRTAAQQSKNDLIKASRKKKSPVMQTFHLLWLDYETETDMVVFWENWQTLKTVKSERIVHEKPLQILFLFH